MNRRTFLLSSTALLAAKEAYAFSGFTPKITTAASPSRITSAPTVVSSTSGSTVTPPTAGTPVRYYHVLRIGDVPNGKILALSTADGTNIPYTAARIGHRGDTTYSGVDLLCRFPQNITTAGVTINYTIVPQIPGQIWPTVLPASKTVNQVLADVLANFSNPIVNITGLFQDNIQNGTQVGSGNWTMDLATALNAAQTAGTYPYISTTDYVHVNAQGPTALDFTVRSKIKDTVGGARHASLMVQFHVIAWLNPTTGAVTDLEWIVALRQGLRTQTGNRYIFQYNVQLAGTATNTIRTYGTTADEGGSRALSWLASSNPINISTGSTGGRIANPASFGFAANEYVIMNSSNGIAGLPQVDVAAESVTNLLHVCVRVTSTTTFKLYWAAISQSGFLVNFPLERQIWPITATTGGTISSGGHTSTISAVNTTTGEFTTSTAHSITNGATAQLTGTLPTCTCGNGPFFVRPDFPTAGTNGSPMPPNFYLFQGEVASFNDSSSQFKPTTQGTGTITLTAYVCLQADAIVYLCRNDGTCDWHSNRTGSIGARPAIFPIQNMPYYVNSGMMLPINLANNAMPAGTTSAGDDASPAHWIIGYAHKYTPGSVGQISWSTSQSGAQSWHGIMTQWSTRTFANRAEPMMAQTARTQGLQEGSFPIHMLNDESTWRLPILNNGTNNSGTIYIGANGVSAGTNLPKTWNQYAYYIGTVSSDMGARGGFSPTMLFDGQLDPTHYPHGVYGPYITEGGQTFYELLMSTANAWLMVKKSDVTAVDPGWSHPGNLRQGTFPAPYNILYQGFWQIEPRGHAWALVSQVQGAVCANWDEPDGPYFRDVANDAFAAFSQWNQAGAAPPSYYAAGLLNTGGLQAPEGYSSSAKYFETFMQGYQSMAAGMAHSMWNTTSGTIAGYGGSLEFAQYKAKYHRRMMITANSKGRWCHQYAVCMKPTASSTSPYGMPTDDWWADPSNVSTAAAPYADSEGSDQSLGGTITYDTTANTITYSSKDGLFSNGDQVWWSKGNDDAFGTLPSTITVRQLYFIVNLTTTATTQTFQVSATLGGSPITIPTAPTGGFMWCSWGAAANQNPVFNWNYGSANSGGCEGRIPEQRAATILLVNAGVLEAAAYTNINTIWNELPPGGTWPTPAMGFNMYNAFDLVITS